MSMSAQNYNADITHILEKFNPRIRKALLHAELFCKLNVIHISYGCPNDLPKVCVARVGSP
ncbi:MAG: hypothetical protein VX803_01790, partial [Pseudomonadota bacterium]|nr:hypothetical protein [Pseudomonadota bacterium]